MILSPKYFLLFGENYIKMFEAFSKHNCFEIQKKEVFNAIVINVLLEF